MEENRRIETDHISNGGNIMDDKNYKHQKYGILDPVRDSLKIEIIKMIELRELRGEDCSELKDILRNNFNSDIKEDNISILEKN